MADCIVFDRCNHCDCDKSFCLRKYKLETLFHYTKLDETQYKRMSLTVDTDGSDLLEFQRLAELENNILDFVNNRQNLIIHSAQCGNGKSSWSIRFIQAYINKIWSRADLSCKALFINVPRFLVAVKNNISQADEYAEFIKANYLKADLVVWDDIANKTATAYEVDSILLPMLEARGNKSNIYTTNLNQAEMTKALGERITSRVFNKSIDIEFKGADKRGLRR